MTAIPRSKSAPTSVQTTFGVSALTRSASEADLGWKRQRVQAGGLRSLVEREDPFNLGTFFPATPRGGGRGEDGWNWLRPEVEDEDGDEGLVDELSGDMMLGQNEEAETKETIDREDKLGVLSLGRLFEREDYTDDRLFSPYSKGESVGVESLYLILKELGGEGEMGTAARWMFSAVCRVIGIEKGIVT